MNKKGILKIFLAIIILVIIVAFWYIITEKYLFPKELKLAEEPELGNEIQKTSKLQLQQLLFIVIATFVIFMLSLIFKPVRVIIEEYFNFSLCDTRACRIFIFGMKGSGKTTLIKSYITKEKFKVIPTPDLDIYKGKVLFDYNKNKYIKFQFADYGGEKPSQIKQDLPRSFLGSKKNRLVNALFFIVDFFPRIEENGRIIENEDDIFKRLETDFEGYTSERIAAHRDYINQWQIEEIIALLKSDNLISVRLLINKYDMIERALLKKLINVNPENLLEYVKDQFKEITNNISRACEENDVNLLVENISASKDQGIRNLFDSVIDLYLSKIK